MCLCRELENTSIVNIGCDKLGPSSDKHPTNLLHKSLENAWNILQAKWHDSEFQGVENTACESGWTRICQITKGRKEFSLAKLVHEVISTSKG